MVCVFGKAVDCKYWSSCGKGEVDVDPSDCPMLSYILREAYEQERTYARMSLTSPSSIRKFSRRGQS